MLWKEVVVEAHYCSNCGSRLEPDAKFCWNCGRPVHVPDQAPKPEEDAPTSRLSSSSSPPLPPLTVPPAAPPPTSPPPLPQPQSSARGDTRRDHVAPRGDGRRWDQLADAGARGGVPRPDRRGDHARGDVGGHQGRAARRGRGAGRERGILPLAQPPLRRSHPAQAVFNGSVVVLAAFAAFLFLIS